MFDGMTSPAHANEHNLAGNHSMRARQFQALVVVGFDIALLYCTSVSDVDIET
jgi:hypothetical protein